jgi:hypothetical protein
MGSKTKRPLFVWIIAIYYTVTLVAGALSICLILSHAIPISMATRAEFTKIPVFDYGASTLVALMIAVSTYNLFLMRKVALPLYVAAFILNLALLIWDKASNSIAIKGGYPILAVTGSFAVALYAAHLTQKRLLK